MTKRNDDPPYDPMHVVINLQQGDLERLVDFYKQHPGSYTLELPDDRWRARQAIKWLIGDWCDEQAASERQFKLNQEAKKNENNSHLQSQNPQGVQDSKG